VRRGENMPFVVTMLRFSKRTFTSTSRTQSNQRLHIGRNSHSTAHNTMWFCSRRQRRYPAWWQLKKYKDTNSVIRAWSLDNFSNLGKWLVLPKPLTPIINGLKVSCTTPMIDHLVIFQILLTLGREFEPAAQAILDLFIFLFRRWCKATKNLSENTGTLSISRLIFVCWRG
jgi:hypothetical protein